MSRRLRHAALAIALCACTLPQMALAEAVTLNLKDAEIQVLVETVADITGKNFVIDPRVKGRVSVVSGHPLNKDEIYKTFLSILEVHGFSTIPSGKVIKIVPEARAKQTGIPTMSGADVLPGDQIVTQVIQVGNVTATELVPILRPLVPQQGHLAAYPATNVLILSDRASNVARLSRIIARIDQVSDSAIDIVPLEHASATDMVRVLNNLQKKPKAGGTPADQVQLAADERTNSILLSGERSARMRLRAFIGHLDTPLGSSGNTHVVFLRYAKAKDLLPVLTGISDTIDEERQKTGITTPNAVNIQADEPANALVITAPPDVFRALKQVVNQLDIRRAQVLVDGIIAEVNLDTARQLGVEWIIEGTNNGTVPIGVTNFGGDASIVNIASAVAADNIPPVGSGISVGIGRLRDTGINFAVLMRALADDVTTNVLSTPSIVTLDNEQAEIVVAQNVPFITGQYANTGATTPGVNPFQTIEREDIGLTLRVTPQINEGNAVQLEIEQEVSSLAASTVSATDLITNKKVIKTTVMVDDGRTIVLGGLIDENLQETQRKVPVLGDIPLLGRLFRSDSTQKTKNNLMIFLRPVILRDAAIETQVSSGKYSYLRAQQLQMRERGVSLMPSETAPVLPENFVDLPAPFGEPPAERNEQRP